VITRRLLLAGLAGLTLMVPFADASPESPTTAEVVAAIKDTYRNVITVRADFTQIRVDPITKVEDKQKGRLSLKRPRKMRFDVLSPTPRTFVTDGTTLWFYDPAQKQVIEQADMGSSGSGSGVGVLLDDLSKLDELFETSLLPENKPSSHTLHLVPRKEGVFKSLDLTVSKQKYVLQDLVLVDPMGAVTEMHFTGVRFDADVADTEFVFVAPPGVQVIKAGM